MILRRGIVLSMKALSRVAARLFCFNKGRNGCKKQARTGSAEQQGN